MVARPFADSICWSSARVRDPLVPDPGALRIDRGAAVGGTDRRPHRDRGVDEPVRPRRHGPVAHGAHAPIGARRRPWAAGSVVGRRGSPHPGDDAAPHRGERAGLGVAVGARRPRVAPRRRSRAGRPGGRRPARPRSRPTKAKLPGGPRRHDRPGDALFASLLTALPAATLVGNRVGGRERPRAVGRCPVRRGHRVAPRLVVRARGRTAAREPRSRPGAADEVGPGAGGSDPSGHGGDDASRDESALLRLHLARVDSRSSRRASSPSRSSSPATTRRSGSLPSTSRTRGSGR